MVRFNGDYSDYYDDTDEDYPEGKAVNATSSDSFDGTPVLADFMNDVNAAHIAMYEKAYGKRTGISGKADTQKSSQFADAVEKYVNDAVAAHADERGLSDGVHGATSEAVAGQLMTRDGMGRAQVAPPAENADVANKGYVDGRTKFRVNVTKDANLGSVATDGIIEVSAAESVKVSVGSAVAVGIEVRIYNVSEVAHTLEVNGEEFELAAGKEVTLYWAGRWKADCRISVDDVYVQYGGMKFPQELFPCTKWENISKDFEGEFFRVAGGNSASEITEYSGGVYAYKHQDDCMQGHRHNIAVGLWSVAQYSIGNGGDNTYGRNGPTVSSDPVAGNYGTPRVGSETRPVNSAIQLWRRVS